MPEPSMIHTAVYNATYWATFTTFTLGWSFRAAGRHFLPKTGPVLILANHQSHFDPLMIGLCSNRRLRFLARSTLFKNRLFSSVIRYFGAEPIDRDFGKDGLKTALNLLKAGEAVVVFPEGERTHTGEIQALKPGISLLLKKVKCPVMPVGIAGAFDAWPRHRPYPIPAPIGLPSDGRSIAVVYGAPIPAAVWEEADRAEMLHRVDQAMRACHTQADQLKA